MGKDYGKGLYSPRLMKEIRSRFLYVDWDPYSGKRIYFEAASGSPRPKSVIEAMAKEKRHAFLISKEERILDSLTLLRLLHNMTHKKIGGG